ncbi:MAG: sigma-70 family RNA polymerase sigma factor [Clostridiaceae bacterium]|nr:sigma-70 family RNA polymerase sigma factor [Clostridiaceae bacterium]
MREQLDRNEGKWLKQAKEGNTDAFANIVELYLPKIYSLCLKLTGNKEDAEDCVQDTFIKVWTSLGEFRESSSIYTWIYRIAANTCNDHLRKMSRHRVLSLEGAAMEDDVVPLLYIRDDRPLPDEQLANRESAENVRRLLQELPDNMREVLVLRDIQQLSYKEISLATGVAEGTVKSRLFRARQEMLKLIEKKELFET